MAASRLSLYNKALMLLGERALSSLSENREPRRYLDTAWNNGAIDYCLEAGQWKFAMRSVRLDYSPSIDPAFGFEYAFDKPADHVRLGGFFTDETMQSPLLQYREEAGFWFAHQDTIYVRYVSNDPEYGGDLSLWPQTFVKFVEAHLASEIAMALTQNRSKFEDMLTLRDKKFLPDALSKDAMQDPTKFPPPSNWTMARMSGTFRRDRGSRGGLIG